MVAPCWARYGPRFPHVYLLDPQPPEVPAGDCWHLQVAAYAAEGLTLTPRAVIRAAGELVFIGELEAAEATGR